MANKKSLTRWVLQHKGELNPSFTNFDWPERYYPGLWDFEASICVRGQAFVGRGVDPDQKLAVEKATAEAIERFICHRLSISSVGVAVSGAVSAQDHAKMECLERYFFDRHFRMESPFCAEAARDGHGILQQRHFHHGG